MIGGGRKAKLGVSMRLEAEVVLEGLGLGRDVG